MDEVLDQMVKSVITDDDVEEDPNKKNFEGMYKNWGRLVNQEQRRKDMLEIQKGQRRNVLDEFRGIVDLVKVSEENNIFQDTKRTYYRPAIHVSGFSRTSYKNILMMSEWLIEKPVDFHENWVVIPVPKGMRVLVVASKGTTKAFAKNGRFKLERHTALPGGNTSTPGYHNRCCVLDCFYAENVKTMFVLDIIAWNNQLMADGEAEFRHFWLKSHFREIPELQEITTKNKLIFKILPHVPCARQSFDEFMMTIPYFPNFNPELDGLLFYHKLAHYYAGSTPLAGWLYPFMVPEVFGPDVTVNPAYMAEKPDGYVSQADFIKKFEENASLNRNRRREIAGMEE